MSFSMAGGSYSYNRFNNFDKLVEGAKPDFLDMDKDGNKKETFKKAVKDKEKGCKDCGKEDCGCDDKKEVKEAMSPGPRKDKMAAKQHNPYTSTRDRANAFNISTRGDGPGTPGYEKKSTGGKGARYAGYGDQGAGNKARRRAAKITKEDVMHHLIDEGFVNNEVSAEVLFNHMSDDWLISLETAIEEGMHRDAKTGEVVKKAEIGKTYYPNMPKRKTSVAIRKEKG
jgi:hypothetical protein